ncbi:MAG: DHA2 family efflux MFS transporter permease subunit [Alphaproteobacteria bacterium]
MAATDTKLIPRGLILLAMSLCTMLYAVTLTIVNVVLPQLQGALAATPEEVSWVVTLNVIATAVVTPATGWMVSRWGHRKVILWSIVGFSVSSLLCATADTLIPLLIYRIGQGAFGAPLVPLSQAIIVAVYPPERRAFAQGIFGMSVVLGPAIAPVLGGYLAEEYNWRFVFILILPMCAATLLFVWLWVHDPGERSKSNLDWTGFLMFSLVITCAQLMMDRGERQDWFESYEIWGYLAVIVAALWVFLVHSATTDNPFIKRELFRDRNFSIGLALVFIYGMLNITPTVMIPTMLQNLMGYPDSMIGVLLAARGVGMVLGFFVVAQIAKFDPRIGMILGVAAIGVSGWNMALFNLEVDPLTIALSGVLQGIGSAVMWVPLSIVAFATLPVRLFPDASSIFHLLRNFGSSIFISVSVLTVSRTGKISYSELSENISAFTDITRYPEVMGLWSFESVQDLAALGSEVNRQALMVGYANSFALYALAAFSAIPLMLLVKIKR